MGAAVGVLGPVGNSAVRVLHLAGYAKPVVVRDVGREVGRADHIRNHLGQLAARAEGIVDRARRRHRGSIWVAPRDRNGRVISPTVKGVVRRDRKGGTSRLDILVGHATVGVVNAQTLAPVMTGERRTIR